MTIRLGGPVLLVGAGKMGGAMLERWLETGLSPADIFIQDPSPPPEVVQLAERQGLVLDGAANLPRPPAVVVLATKPQMFDSVLPGVKKVLGEDSVVLSIAAGRTVASMEKVLGKGVAVVRAMPNTPAAIGRGITAVYSNPAVSSEQAERCIMLLSAVGQVAWVEEETLIDAVTAVSGSGPAYVFLLTECLAQAGVEAGLDSDLAMRLARATVSGAGELMRRSELEPAELRRNVTSPAGTTAAALEVLMGGRGLQELMTRAVAAAAKRAKELSD